MRYLLDSLKTPETTAKSASLLFPNELPGDRVSSPHYNGR